VLAIDTSRRVGWARYYSEAERNSHLQTLCEAYRDRIDVLVPEFLGLVEAVLHERNLEAFAKAYRVQTLIEQFEHEHQGASR
jgi:hypothetical protein